MNRLRIGTGLGGSARGTADRRSDDSLYVRVARILKEEIVSGVHPVGALLPTEAELCKRFSISRHTVREALRRLREDRLVSSRQGTGTLVVPRRQTGEFILDAVSINDLASYASEMRLEIESARTEIVDGKRASRIGVAGGDEWLVVRGFGNEDGHELPLCWSEHYINRDFAEVGPHLPRHSGPIFLLIEELFAQEIVEIGQDISASLVSSALADSLKVKAGTAAIEVRRTYWTADGKVVQITLHTHPASRFRHAMTMRRARG